MSTIGGPRLSTIPTFQNAYSMDFDGVDDYVKITNGNFNVTNGLTLSFWVKYDGVGAGINWVFSNGGTGGANSQFNTRLAADGRWFNYLVGGAFYTGINGLSDGNWHHLTQVIDYGNSIMHFYKDGIKSTPTRASSYSQVDLGTISTTFYPFKGQVDEVALIGRVLTQQEITSISSAPTDLTSLNPLAWYRMGDNGAYKDPQWLIPSNENKDKFSNYSLSFDGVDDRVQLTSDFVANGEFTISFWMKPTTISGNGNIYVMGTFPNNDNYIKNDQIGVMWLRIGATTLIFSESYLGSLNNILVLNEWQNITFIRDSFNVIRCYRNGTSFGNPSTPPTNSNTLTLNSFGRIITNTFGFNGGLDEIALFNTDQTSNIATIYNGGEPTTISGAVAHYKMGEEATFSGGVWTVPDAVGSNDGTSNAMTIEDRVGSSPNSDNNTLSFNMGEVDRTTDVPT